MTSVRNVVLAPIPFALVALVALAGGCSITTNDTSDGGTTPLPGVDGSTPGTDGGGSTGVLGFNPSNLGALLEGLDLSTVVDIDVTTVGTYASLECGTRANGSCITKSITQSDGSTVAVYIAKSWKIEPTVDMAVNDKTPVILVATDTITVLGKITSTASMNVATGGGFASTASPLQGAGPGGGGAESSTSGSKVGGGGAGHCGAGGAGGAANATLGVAGATYGNATIIPLQGGSAGGGSNSGGGGGAFQLVAGTSITIAAGGAVSAGGGGGYYSQVGAGSGGAVLLEAPVVTVAGDIAVNGGGGAATGNDNFSGADGLPSATPALGGANGTAGAGGNGSAAASLAGTDGAAGDGEVTYGPAGGGGGAGWIRINTRTGSAVISGTFSPPATTSCTSQGTLN